MDKDFEQIIKIVKNIKLTENEKKEKKYIYNKNCPMVFL